MYSKRFDKVRNVIKSILKHHIARGIVGGVIAADIAFAIPATCELMSGHWKGNLILLPVAALLGILGGTIGIAVAGGPCCLLGLGIGIAEQYRTKIRLELLWLWYLVVPNIFALISAKATLLIYYEEWLWVEIALLGFTYALLRIVEIYWLKILKSIIFWIMATVCCYYVLDLLFLRIVEIIDYQRPFVGSIIIGTMVLIQRIYGGIAEH